jgi:hypothetical protein
MSRVVGFRYTEAILSYFLKRFKESAVAQVPSGIKE